MEVLPQPAFTVATTEGKSKPTREYMLRVRLSPPEVYSLKGVSNHLGLNESATIRWLINNYSEVVAAKKVTEAFRRKLEAEASFNAVMDSR